MGTQPMSGFALMLLPVALLTTTNLNILLLSIGPSTKLLHSLYSKISQYTELTNHTMRFNAFIFGLLK